MHVLVTGGAGFIGSHTVEALLAAGERVRVFDNFSAGKRENLAAHSALQVVDGDIRDSAAVAAAMADITRVLHLAAQVSVVASVVDPANSCANNIQGHVNVLDAARKAGVTRVVYASSAAVYGVSSSLPLDESSPVNALSPYGLEKSVNDQYAALFGGLYGLSCLGLRYFNVYGPRQDPRSPYAGVISKFTDWVRKGETLRVHGDGMQTRDFIYVKDVARANVAALRSAATGVVNVGTGRSVTLMEMIAALSAGVGRQLGVEHLPPREGDIRESATRVTRMVEELGIVPGTTLNDGLRALLESEHRGLMHE